MVCKNLTRSLTGVGLTLGLTLGGSLHAASYEWTWLAGSNGTSTTPVYGTQGVEAPGNTPAGGGITGRDSTGKIWLYTGTGNVWRYDPATTRWTWLNGGGSTALPPNWGTKGVAAPTNFPGARSSAIAAWDTGGRLWLYGGIRADSTAQTGQMNDLWCYDGATNQWTWRTGSTLRWQFSATYGTRGVAAVGNQPNARSGGAAAVDSQGRFVFFGGLGQNPMSDIWRFDPVTGWWTWVGGTSSGVVQSVCGVKGVPSTSNYIGSRRSSAAMWLDTDGSIWLFGGYGMSTAFSETPQNDLWRYQPATNEWTWMTGEATVNTSTNFYGYRGVYGTKGQPAAANSPGSRENAAAWRDAQGNFWLLGGYGLDGTDPNNRGSLNDLWKFTPSTSLWSWHSGAATQGQTASFGIQGVASATNSPGARQGSSNWSDPAGTLFLLGAGGSADIWSFDASSLPEARVTTAGTDLADGASYAMPGTPVGGSSQVVFQLSNTGVVALTGISASITGTNAGEFSLAGPAVTSLAPGESTTVTVTFNPSSSAARTAELQILSNDLDESPYNITLTDASLGPDIAVEFPAGTGLTDGVSSVQLPNTDVGWSSAPQTFALRNTGASPLTGIGITKTGSHGAEFTVSGVVTTLAPGASATFTVVFTPTAGGTRTAGLQISSNDADENPFDISLNAQGVMPQAGTVDPAFTPTANGGYVHCVQPDGKIILGGTFSSVRGVSRAGLARLNADTTLDTGFNPGTDSSIYTIVVQQDGKILVGGAFHSIAGASRNYLARLNADGSLDTAFSPNLNGNVWYMVEQPDKKILIAGSFSAAGGGAATNLARLNADGSLDTSFNPAAETSAEVFVISLLPGGKMYVGGFFGTIGGLYRPYLARLNADGTADASFSANVSYQVCDIAPLGDGRLVIGGYFSTVGGATHNRVARLEANGAVDPSFTVGTSGTNNYVLGLLPQTDGKVIVGGDFTGMGLYARTNLGRINADGSVDAGFDPNLTSSFSTMNMQKDGKVVLHGLFGSYAVGRLLNDPATESLLVMSTSKIRWLRGGASPEAHRVSFELSTNGGTTWQMLGQGTRIAGGWELGGVSLPPSGGQVRARAAYASSGYKRSSSGLVQTIATYSNVSDLPEIVVEQPAATDLTDGGSRAFGTTSVGASSTLSFTLKNTGNAALSGISITKDGTNAADFSVTASPASSVPGQSSTTFTVDFIPSATGVRSAVLHIASNDEDENPFDITLTGTAISPEITVNSPAGSGLTDGAAVTLPTINSGSGSASQYFTIYNTGSAPLTGVSVAKAGLNSSEFALTQPPTTIAAGDSATFSVIFWPVGSYGPRTATLQVASNDVDENPFDITLNAVAAAPEIDIEQPVGTGLADGVSTVDFGPVLVGGNAVQAFTIRNSGTQTLTGLSLSKTGTDSATFTLGSLSVSSLAAGASTTFTVTFTPGAAVTRNAILRVASNDSDENPFDINLTGLGALPEIAIEQPAGTDLTDGVSSVSFPSTNVASTATKTFVVRNLGNVPLTGLALSKVGTNTADFILGSLSTTSLAAGETLSFDVSFTPQAFGARTTTLRVASNDSNETPFDLILTGTGLATEIAVEQPVGTGISDGGSKSYGSVLLGGNSSLTFTVKNIGNVDLTDLTITKDGANADDFTVTQAAAQPVAGPSGSTTFTVQFTPAALGSRTAVFHIANNDSDENPFDITLTGTGIAPEIAVEYPSGTGLVDGVSTISLPTTVVGGNNVVAVTVRNTGTGSLTGLSLTKDGTHAADFTLSSITSSVSAGSSTTFNITFAPAAAGTRTAAIHINSSDADESPFDIQLSATATAGEIEVEEPVGTGLVDGVSTVDFGSVALGANAVRTFTIRNTGTAALTGVGLTKAGSESSNFVLGYAGGTTLAIAGQTTFTVTFSPGSLTQHNAVVRISSSDPDEAPFDINVTGSGTAPEIVIEQPVGTHLTDNVSTVTFPTTLVGQSAAAQTFTVRNSGSAALSGLGLSKTGAHVTDFVLPALSVTSLAPGESTSFDVVFTPTAGGARTATLLVSSNDQDENPFEIALSGTATAPAIVIEQPTNNPLVSGTSTIDFGELAPGSSIARTFRVRNSGTAPLTSLVLSKTGPNAGSFSLGSLGATTLAPGATTTFLVSYSPHDGGYHGATLAISSNAANTALFSINLVGGGLAAEINVSTLSAGDLLDGASAVEFGRPDVGAALPVTRTFIIRSDGIFDLAALALSVSGAASSDYTVSPLGITSLATGSTVSFNVSFSPSVSGARPATLHITSNDDNESPFDIALTGTGMTNADHWRRQHFGRYSAEVGDLVLEGEFEDDQDPDHDGLSNLMEFATGEQPTQSTASLQSLAPAGAGQLIYMYQRSLDAVADGVTFTVQHNATLDPAGWSATGVVESVVGDDGLVQTVQAVLPAPAGGGCFVRLSVSR